MEVQRECAEFGCHELVASGRCPKHLGTRDKRRGSSHHRGYNYTWQKFREGFISRHPLCEDCKEQGLIVGTEEVHHVRKVAEHPELKLVESNCRALCKACHSTRTARGE